MSRGTCLEGKCGSCRFFTYESEESKNGFCSGINQYRGRIARTYKCRAYRKAKPSNFDNLCLAPQTLATFLVQLVKNGPDIAAGGTRFRYGGVSVAEWCDWLTKEAEE